MSKKKCQGKAFSNKLEVSEDLTLEKIYTLFNSHPVSLLIGKVQWVLSSYMWSYKAKNH